MTTTSHEAVASPGAPVQTLALRVLLASFAGPALPEEWRDLLVDGLGGICLFGSNLTGSRAETAALVDAVRAARPDALVAVDEEGGDVTRLHTRTASPALGAAVLGAADDVDLTEATGRAVGVDLAAVGIDLDLGPVADVNSNPDNPVIGTRSFGATPDLAARHVAAWVRGLQSAGVAACVKHFPGHGDTAQDSHLTLPVLEASEETLAARELPPFAAAVAAGAASVMTSHLVVPALDPELPATLSAPILGRLRELGFDGAIVSDALDMAGASGEDGSGRGIPEAAVLALVAGADLLCVGPDKEAALIRETRAAIVAAGSPSRPIVTGW
ncbi:glycoside hydrolase family 3 N-terminal domain-containing protein [Nocardioides sp. YIM 152588]|uniref:glycoside hydrolase family 3 N-terminal domain-containing protein n=1 Tax=Nocardioides sp. YIM 152588 TaxID=3158259 RepID=UPI0032E43C9B